MEIQTSEPLRRRRNDREGEHHRPNIPRSNVVRLTLTPSHDEIAQRAYELYEERGRVHGRDWEDWLQAERELHQLARDKYIFA